MTSGSRHQVRGGRQLGTDVLALTSGALVAGSSAAIALAAGFVVHDLRLRLEVVPGVLYLRHVQHGCDEALGQCGSASTVLIVLAFTGLLLAMFIAYRSDPTRIANLPLWVRVGIGLFAGGALANSVELMTVGSVADFVGLYGLGIFSIGDLEMGVGGGILAASQWVLTAGHPLGHEPRHVITGWTAALGIALLLSNLDGRRWAVLLSMVLVVGMGWATGAILVGLRAAKGRQTRRRRSRRLRSP
jgi:lipoprotein signal peptidase